MNRLQKKCLIASVATHGSLLVILFVGPAFLTHEDTAQSAKVLTMITLPADDAPSSDAGSTSHPAQPSPAPPPIPAVAPIPAPLLPTPPAPKQVTMPKPLEIPKPAKTGDDFKRVTPPTTEPTRDFTPVSRPPTRPTPKVKPADSSDADAAAQQIIAKRLANRINKLTSSLASENSLQIGPTSDRGEAVSNYRDIVYSIYTAAWQPPSSITDDAATVTVRVTIARDGQVSSHEIVKASGNAAMDKSIENTLNSVTVLVPFPAGSKDLERTYSIKFDISAKRSLD